MSNKFILRNAAWRSAWRRAREGRTGRGEVTIWRCVGYPAFKTVPEPDGNGGWQSHPRVYIQVDGEWKDMGAFFWSSHLFSVSRLPGFHPVHICGLYCDGRDGNGQCSDERAVGPPSKTPLQALAEGACADDTHTEDETTEWL